MKNKCKSYHLQPKTRYTYHPLTGSPIAHDIEVGVCWGTKECDECLCGGDMTQCDFYPEVRAKERKSISIQDAINHFEYGISHDIFSEPVTTYAKMAVESLKKQVPKKPKKEEKVSIHRPHFFSIYRCPNCNHIVKEYEDGWGSNSQLRNEHCNKCSQALDWE